MKSIEVYGAHVISTINGRSVEENLKIAIENLCDEIKSYLSSYEAFKTDRKPRPEDPVWNPVKSPKVFGGLVEELRDVVRGVLCGGVNTYLAHLVTLFPTWTRLFHTRKREVTATPMNLMRFLQIGPYAILLDSSCWPDIFTAEQAIKYADLRTKPAEEITQEDVDMIRLVESLDRVTVLQLWVDGVPIHQAIVPYFEELPEMKVDGLDDLRLFRFPIQLMLNNQHRLRRTVLTKQGSREVPDFQVGLCVPDHTCCQPNGGFTRAFREVVLQSPVERREDIQIENLMQRMKAEYEAQKRK